MKTKRKIRRRCICGCGEITNYGKKYIRGHNSFGNTYGRYNKGIKKCEETRKKMSLGKMGNTYGKGNKGKRSNHSEGTKKKISLSLMGNTNSLEYKHSKEMKKKVSLSLIGNVRGRENKDRKLSENHKRKLSIAKMGNTYMKGKKQSKETVLKKSISLIKYNPNYEYCDIWKDKEYVKDLRKNYCENINCRGKSKRLNNHHIGLDKKNCHPNNIMTLCAGCHTSLHHNFGFNADPKDFIVVNRPDHITYINKKIREKIVLRIKI